MYRSLSDDTDQPGDAPAYTFEGFKVDFSEKVMLSPWEDEDRKRKPRERKEA